MQRFEVSEGKIQSNQSTTADLYTCLKKSVKETAMGAPSLLATKPLAVALKMAGSSVLPNSPLFKPNEMKPETPAKWITKLPHQKPVNWMLEQSLVSPKTAIRLHVPVAEEVFFRGVVMQGMEKGLEKMGLEKKSAKIAAAVGNSLFFAATHSKAGKVAALTQGLVLSGITYMADGSLVPAIAGHVVNNTVELQMIEKAGRIAMRR